MKSASRRTLVFLVREAIAPVGGGWWGYSFEKIPSFAGTAFAAVVAMMAVVLAARLLLEPRLLLLDANAVLLVPLTADGLVTLQSLLGEERPLAALALVNEAMLVVSLGHMVLQFRAQSEYLGAQLAAEMGALLLVPLHVRFIGPLHLELLAADGTGMLYSLVSLTMQHIGLFARERQVAVGTLEWAH